VNLFYLCQHLVSVHCPHRQIVGRVGGGADGSGNSAFTELDDNPVDVDGAEDMIELKPVYVI